MRLFRDEYSPFVSIRLFVQYRTTVLVIPAYFVSRIRILSHGLLTPFSFFFFFSDLFRTHLRFIVMISHVTRN